MKNLVREEKEKPKDLSPILAKRIIYPDGFLKCIYDKTYQKLIFISHNKILVFNKSMTKAFCSCELNWNYDLSK